MRRAFIPAVLLVAAVATGCGGGSNRTAGHPAAQPGSHGAGATVTAVVSEGRLGGALIARPGKTLVRGHVEKFTGQVHLPPSKLHGVAAEDSCTDQTVEPTPDNLAHVGDVIFCLMNAMRADNGLPALRLQSQLTQASLGHSQDMVQNQYFAHDSQDGRDVVARLKQVGYIPAVGDWVIGENLAWGSGSLGTPQALVNAWMNSPEHRANLLATDYQDVGMGVVYGTPSPDAPDGVTVTTDFGTRPQSAAASGTTAAKRAVVGAVSGVRARASKRAARKARRRRAIRRCERRHPHRGRARTRCVHAARHLR